MIKNFLVISYDELNGMNRAKTPLTHTDVINEHEDLDETHKTHTHTNLIKEKNKNPQMAGGRGRGVELAKLLPAPWVSKES